MKHIALGLALALGLASLATACESKSAAAPNAGETPDRSAKVVDVKVDGSGFSPSSVSLKAHEKATLRFTRTSDQTCAKKVVFPDLKMEWDLPLNKAVDVAVPTDSARTLAFQCGMGMFKSSVVIN